MNGQKFEKFSMTRVIALLIGGPMLIVGVAQIYSAFNRSAPDLLGSAVFALPFVVMGAFLLIVAVWGKTRNKDSGGEQRSGHAPDKNTAEGPVKNLQPEGKLEGFGHLLAYGWLGICGLALLKCFMGLVSAGTPAPPLWTWCVPFSGIPVFKWVRRRSQFFKRWGRCELHLLAPAELGKPFAGVVEAGARLVPTQDFHFTLLYEEGMGDVEDSWSELSRAEQFVSRDRMDDSGLHSRIPFAFETLSPGNKPRTRYWSHRWRLVFRTQLDGQKYEESFSGGLADGEPEQETVEAEKGHVAG